MVIGQTLGSYRLERVLGSGGMGDVYLGVHPQIGSRVAVKVLHARHAQDRTLVERFLNEARAVNTIHHDAIVNILDLGTLPDGRPYLVMEYHDGVVLGEVMRQRGALPLAGATRVVGDVLAGLAAAHRRLIIHRDLKPDNVYVTVSGRAYLLDFGLAKLVGEKGTIVLTRKGTWLGTPHYMAPEQIDGRKVDPRCDLYAVGVILFHAATGRVPFDAEAIEDIFRHHLATPPPAPRALRPEIPASLEAVILRAMEKDPARRFGSAREMGAHLERAAADLPGGRPARLNLAETLGPTVFPLAGTSPTVRAAPGLAYAATQPPPTPPPPRPPAAVVPVTPAVAPAPATSSRHLALIAGGAAALLVIGGLAGTVGYFAGRAGPPAGPRVPTEPRAPRPGARSGAAGAGSPRAPAATVADLPPARVTRRGGVTTITTAAYETTLPLGDLDPRRFDALGFRRRAQALAATRIKDPVMVDFEVQPVATDGRVDLTAAPDGAAELTFRTRVVAGPECPICFVKVTPKGIEITVSRGDSLCREAPRAPWRCSLAEAWRRARRQGLAPLPAKVSWLADGWYFDLGDQGSESVRDDCP